MVYKKYQREVACLKSWGRPAKKEVVPRLDGTAGGWIRRKGRNGE
jgi:hypothetical protein